jgi:hypothetical protein
MLAFIVAFAEAFGVFATATTAVLFSLFLFETRSEPDFLQFLMSGGYHRIFFALLLGSIWFCLVLVSNLRHDEGATNSRIDSWIRRMDRSHKDAGER